MKFVSRGSKRSPLASSSLVKKREVGGGVKHPISKAGEHTFTRGKTI
jgi:hypothetical protein